MGRCRMHWVLQTNIFNEVGYNTLIETLERFAIAHSVHKVVPFVGSLDPMPVLSTKNVICMGSYSMRHVAKENEWNPGVFDLEPFDFMAQLNAWGGHMLNADAVVSRFEDVIFTEDEMFIRPVHDSKVFAGQLTSAEEFTGWKNRVCVLEHDYGDRVFGDTLVQVCNPKKIFSEHRFWVVKGQIVTCSTYKIGNRVVYHPEENVDHRFWGYVEDRIACVRPHDAFVIDVADTAEGLKIVEVNTLNSSGFYAGDVQKLVFALEDAFTEKE